VVVSEHHSGTGIFVHKRIILIVKEVQFIGDVCNAKRSLVSHIIVLNVHAPTEDKSDITKNSFYKELEHVFDQFSKYHMKMLFVDFSAKVGRKVFSN